MRDLPRAATADTRKAADARKSARPIITSEDATELVEGVLQARQTSKEPSTAAAPVDAKTTKAPDVVPCSSGINNTITIDGITIDGPHFSTRAR